MLLGPLLYANNIAVSNVSLTGLNTTAGANHVNNFTLIQFNLSWENSWRISTGPSNWDAAWVFVKFRVGASNPTFIGVSSSGTSVTVSSTTNLRVGMPLRVTSGTGAFAANSVISSITNSTQFVVSAAPTTALSAANIECISIWEHARLNNTGHTAASGSSIDAGLLTPGSAFNATTNPALGVFIYRDANGSGTNTFNNTQLRWNYGANGVADGAVVSVQVFAIEMVNVPQSSFFVGSGGTESGSFTNGSWVSGATIPFQITSEAALGIDNVAGKLWGTSSSGNNSIGNAAADAEATLTAAYPKGFAAFYCMKYEISQGQYRDFLNALTYAQQVTRTAVAPTSLVGTGALSSTNANRNGLDVQIQGNATTLVPAVYGCNLNANTTYNEAADGEWIACNFLSWMDGCAYMQWSGLRPMTELEFEKACRGNQTAVSGEYAWGDASGTGATGISNGGANNETFSNAGANAAFNNAAGVQGPLRVGAFAGAATTRAQAGATYYGIMKMSGNLWERAVTIGNAAGRSYTGLHGNGTLFRDGTANVDFWPGINGNSTTTTANTAFGGTTGITQAAGSGFRGGGWDFGASAMRVSDRLNAANTGTLRHSNDGFRGVRLAP
jgi:formylglycine-generating enzyme required for sulfatase activity